MKVSDLRGILQYIPRFRERIFVIAVDGAIVASENFSNLLLDLAVLRSLNIKVILVHGAGHQIRNLANERGVTISSDDGTGVTDHMTLEICIDAATRLTSYIMQGLTSVDLRAAQANAVIAHPAGIKRGIDQQLTGVVDRIDTGSLSIFLGEGIIPVIPPLGFDGEGGVYRVNSDTIAVEAGEAMHAAKVIYLTPERQLLVDTSPPQQLSIEQAEDLLKRPQLFTSPGMLSKLKHAIAACRRGISRIHLLDGREDESLLAELFSNEGVGTMVYSNEYQQIRPMMKKDIRPVMALIRQSVQDEELARRTKSDISEHLSNYWVLEIDNNIIGCVSLIPYPDDSIAELACLFVSRNHNNEGYGTKLVTYAEKIAQEHGFQKIFALSTQAYAYFQNKAGYLDADTSILPAARLLRYQSMSRNSRILVKELT